MVLRSTPSCLLNQMGEYLTHIGRLEQGRQAFELSLVLTEQAHGPNDPRRAAVINNLGRVMKRAGKLQETRAPFRGGAGPRPGRLRRISSARGRGGE